MSQSHRLGQISTAKRATVEVTIIAVSNVLVAGTTEEATILHAKAAERGLYSGTAWHVNHLVNQYRVVVWVLRRGKRMFSLLRETRRLGPSPKQLGEFVR